MSIKIAVLRERDADERRVAIVPSTLSGLGKLGASMAIQAGAGLGAHYADADYADAAIASDPAAMVADADIVLAVQPPPADVVAAMRPGTVLVGFIHASREAALVEQLRDRRISTFAMEKVPRISRAQTMDALSSQAALAGYYAPLLGAVHLPRILPMMTTAAGSLRAARVLVMGLGVAGLQALSTAHRLGAITEGYDVRPETREQAKSVGARFVDIGVDARGDGGYARALTAEEQAKAREVLTWHIQQADLIVTAANVPDGAAPRLIDHAQIAGMKPGSVIVDLAADGGCNCEGAVPGRTVRIGPVTMLAPPNVPSLLAQHASELYAKNLFHLLELIIKDGTVSLDLDDAIVGGTLLTHAGEIRHAGAVSDSGASSHSPAVAEVQA